LSAIEGHVPPAMLRTFCAFLDFCYTARQAFLTERDLDNLDKDLKDFHQCRRIFTDRKNNTGVWIMVPRQHSSVHYQHIAKLFGAPHGLCTSITKSKHVQAVKKPYRRSSHHEALVQMLLINQRLDKLATCRRALKECGLLCTTVLEDALAETEQSCRDDATERSHHLSEPNQVLSNINDDEPNQPPPKTSSAEYNIDTLLLDKCTGDSEVEVEVDDNAEDGMGAEEEDDEEQEHTNNSGDGNGDEVVDNVQALSHVFLAQAYCEYPYTYGLSCTEL
jgi:hypothetical protein